MPTILMFYGIVIRMYCDRAELHREDLLADWALASNGELPFRIDSLR